MEIRRFAAPLLVLTLGVAACSEEVVGPSVDEVAGTYELTQLIVRQGNAENDLIAAGVTVTITLTQDSATSGSLFIPASVNVDGQEINSDLVGTWSLDGSSVRFHHQPQTFLTDVAWTFQDNEDLAVGDPENWIEATLTRQ